MQDLVRQLRELGFDLEDSPHGRASDAPSGSIRVRLATDRAGLAARLIRLLTDAGLFEIETGERPDPPSPKERTTVPPVVLVLDCSTFAVQQRNWLQRKARNCLPARVLWYLDESPAGTEVAQSVLEAVKLGWCHGFVTSECPPRTILRAISAVARHDFWLPRAMLARAFSESQSLRAAGAGGAPREGDRALGQLTMRERQVLHLVRRGLINKEVGRYLGIEEDTVKKHLRNMYAKLGVHRRAQMLLRSVGEARASG